MHFPEKPTNEVVMTTSTSNQTLQHDRNICTLGKKAEARTSAFDIQVVYSKPKNTKRAAHTTGCDLPLLSFTHPGFVGSTEQPSQRWASGSFQSSFSSDAPRRSSEISPSNFSKIGVLAPDGASRPAKKAVMVSDGQTLWRILGGRKLSYPGSARLVESSVHGCPFQLVSSDNECQIIVSRIAFCRHCW